ncbi:MAG TPA: 16S rRNA (cytosine(967)-C(5))-methyltransferase RsmB [Pyrinomonadaceae bacterium]|jgi:16S rRNA (cytosine967-C5)-methyltransferase
MKARGRAAARPEQRGKGQALVSPARMAAFSILRRVEEDGAYASVLLAESDEELRADDRALSYELVLGTLRRRLWLDSLIEHYSGGRRSESLDAPVLRALRLGLYQLRFLSRIPASAVVNEAVNLAHLSRLRSASGFINAVLRRATREPDYDPAANVSDPIERLAIETSHPAWLIERWLKAFGAEETEAFARASNEAPPVAFRVVPLKASEAEVLEQLRAAGALLTPSEIAPAAWRIQGAGALLRVLAREGKVYVQDEASQLVAHVLDARAAESVLDVCAAPGSKTTHIAARSPGLRLIVAGDLHEHRLATVREASLRQGVRSLSLVVHDASAGVPFAVGAFDRVLVDAPCSGTGTLRRNPEIRWRISPSDIFELAARQQRIVAEAAQMVRRGGRLVYSTCSVETEENEGVIAAFLKENTDFRQVPAETRTAGCGPSVRIWPHREGADGFFIASFERAG